MTSDACFPDARSRTLVMGIVNRTPDSFYDGGRMELDESVDHALRLVSEGAALLDVGAVTAGPGRAVTEDEELERLLPLVAALADRTAVSVSVETGRVRVAKMALAAGASIVNDVGGMSDPGVAGACAEADAGLILMHTGGQIRGRPRHPRFADVTAEVCDELERLAETAVALGVRPEAIVVDPGLDFGKTTYHSLEIVRRLDELVARGRPVLVGPSRKDVVGETLDLPPEARLEGTLALVALSVWKGAAIVRVHDVEAALAVVEMVEAVMGRRPPRAPVRGLWD